MKRFSINSQDWCDIVFENKNKDYGAYEMRMNSSKRHVLAFVIVLIIVALISVIPFMSGKVSAKNTVSRGYDNEIVLANVLYEEMQQEIAKLATPEKPMVELARNTIEFNAFVIGEDDAIPEGLEVKTVDEVLGSNFAISDIDFNQGTNDLSAPVITKEDLAIVEIEQPPLVTAQTMPVFRGDTPGGDNSELYSYIGQNLKYPIIDQQNGTQGRVTIRFVVSKTGEIKDITVLRGISPNCDQEAIRVIKSMPRWIPGMQNNRAVDVYFTLPIVFKLK